MEKHVENVLMVVAFALLGMLACFGLYCVATLIRMGAHGDRVAGMGLCGLVLLFLAMREQMRPRGQR